MKEITIMKTAGRLFSNIEFITVVALTAVALLVLGVVGEGGLAAGMMLETPCKAFLALVNAAVAFSKAPVVFSNLSLTISDIAPPPVALVALLLVVLLVNPLPVVVFLRGSVAFGAGGEEVVATASYEDKLSMNNRGTRIIVVAMFIYTLFVLFIA